MKLRVVDLLAHVRAHRHLLINRTATCRTTRRASSCAPRRCTTRATAPRSSRWSTTCSRHSDATRYYTSRRDRHGMHAVRHRALTHRHIRQRVPNHAPGVLLPPAGEAHLAAARRGDRPVCAHRVPRAAGVHTDVHALLPPVPRLSGRRGLLTSACPRDARPLCDAAVARATPLRVRRYCTATGPDGGRVR